MLVLVATVALTACGSDKGSNTVEGESDSSTPAASAASSPEAYATSSPGASAEPSEGASAQPSAAPMAKASVAPKGNSALPGVPAVKNATDLKKEPEIAKGTGDEPTGLITRDLVVGDG